MSTKVQNEDHLKVILKNFIDFTMDFHRMKNFTGKHVEVCFNDLVVVGVCLRTLLINHKGEIELSTQHLRSILSELE